VGVDEAFQEHVAGPMECSLEEAAFDSWRVVNANMTQAVRRLTAEKGTDPVALTMLAYGGNGPMFAGVQARELGIKRVLVPKASPAFSALGALAALPSLDEERSYLAPAATADLPALLALWKELDKRAEHYLGAAGFQRSKVSVRYQVNLRYPGQNWSLAIDVAQASGPCDFAFVKESMRQRMIEDFHQRHQDEYGHSRLAEPPEITGVRLVASAEVPKPEFGGGMATTSSVPSPATTRQANLGAGFEETRIYRGVQLEPGHVVKAPAIIEETFTTIVVYPGWKATVDDAGDYILERSESEKCPS